MIAVLPGAPRCVICANSYSLSVNVTDFRKFHSLMSIGDHSPWVLCICNKDFVILQIPTASLIGVHHSRLSPMVVASKVG